MILIISKEADYSTSQVIKWIISLGGEYERLGNQQIINSFFLSIGKEDEIEIKIGQKSYVIDDISSFWLRKDTIHMLSNIEINFFNDEDKINSPYLNNYLKSDEMNSIKEFMFHELEKKNHIGNISVGEGNKLISFSIAKEVGFKTPRTIVSSNTNRLYEKFKEFGNMIAKPIEDAYSAIYNGVAVSSSYDLVNDNMFINKDSEIFPSCIQEYIDKKIELRVFFINAQCYSMAIFSQNDEKTKIDFRNYNDEKPNRMVPYNLPLKIREKIILFMKKMKLKSGSLDFVLNSQNEYVFLEVNPVGQYGMVADPCNYPLDKIIAQELMKKQ